MSPAQDLYIYFSTGMLGSVPNIEISTCMGCKLGKDSALPLLKTLFLLLLLILCPKPILPLCYRKGDHPYMFFLTEQWKKLTKRKVFRSDSGGEYISAAFRTLLASTHFTYKALSQRSCPPHSSAEWSCRAEASPYIGDSSLSLALSFCP